MEVVMVNLQAVQVIFMVALEDLEVRQVVQVHQAVQVIYSVVHLLVLVLQVGYFQQDLEDYFLNSQRYTRKQREK